MSTSSKWGPRDGLQNEPDVLSTEDKATFIKMLAAAGLSTIEVTSFVRPDKIPQMKDASKLYAQVKGLEKEVSVSLPVLVPNRKGLERALLAGVADVALFTSTSDTFNQKNTGLSVDESLERLAPVAKEALSKNLRVRGYISTAFGRTSYEGNIYLGKLKEVARAFFRWGIEDISLGDTIGVAHPAQIVETIEEWRRDLPLEALAMHFHDTRGMALANILTSLQLGVATFDSSAAGLGGCPYAKGATGNVATEELLYLCDSLGIETGVDMEKLMAASLFVLQKMNRSPPSKFLKAHLACSTT